MTTKLYLSSSARLPSGDKTRWSTYVDVSNFFTDDKEFCWVRVEKVQPLLMPAAAQQTDALELRCETLVQHGSYDNRTLTSGTTLGFAVLDSKWTSADGSTLVCQFKIDADEAACLRIPYDMLRGKVWTFTLNWSNAGPRLRDGQLLQDYVVQVGVHV